jgi:hypothetical protein
LHVSPTRPVARYIAGMYYYTAVDMASCQKFWVFGQAGALSGWHSDNLSVHTYVGMELESKKSLGSEWVLRGTDDFTWSNEAKTVIKLWAFGQITSLKKTVKQYYNISL